MARPTNHAGRWFVTFVLGATIAIQPVATAEQGTPASAGVPLPSAEVVDPAPLAAVGLPGSHAIVRDDARALVLAIRAAPPLDVPEVVAAPVVAPDPPAPRPQAAPTPQAAPKARTPQEIGREALSRLRFIDPAALGWQVRFHGPKAGYLGLADWESRIIDVWVRPDHDVQDILGTLAHEFAHVYDYEHWTPAVRAAWLDLRGLDIAWWPDCTCNDRRYGAGDVAEALVVLEAGAGEWTGHFGMPTAAQLDWLTSQL